MMVRTASARPSARPPGAGRTHGLEYLFGATHDGAGFSPFWGHDRRGEHARDHHEELGEQEARGQSALARRPHGDTIR